MGTRKKPLTAAERWGLLIGIALSVAMIIGLWYFLSSLDPFIVWFVLGPILLVCWFIWALAGLLAALFHR